MDREQIHVWLPAALKAALDREAAERGSNKSVLLSRILADRYTIAFVPSPASTRRKTPHGGGPRGK